ncbi:BMP family protein [uncultured Jatrophihabitans sp.]|uniref:BMP family lipoprotein n=1 Tax=uncultured Jatrophihabitans sp. TaxID=1610747 RepID=UPI0035CC039D
MRGMQLGAIAVGAALMLSACGSSGGSSSSSGASAGGTSPSGSSSATTKTDVKVGMAYDVGGRGDKSFNDLAAAGLDKAKTTLGVSTKELAATQNETEAAKESRLTLLASSGYNPVVAVGFAYATAVGKVVPKFPKVHFAIIDDDTNCTGSAAQPNVECLLFNEEQSSFLVGVAAALATKTKNVGFIGGVNEPLIQKFQAGFQAGVKAVNPAIKVQAKYLTQPPDFGGFGDPAKGKTTAEGMYDNGADVVYAAAGGSGAGLFDAAAEDKKLAIGVDSDQYQSAPANEKQYILTSALKGVDTAVYNFISTDIKGQFKAGSTRFGLKVNGVGYATSNSKLDPYKAKIEAFKAKIISGAITVPTTI